MIRKDIKVKDWIEIRYNGRTYFVAVKSLITAWIHEQNKKEAA